MADGTFVAVLAAGSASRFGGGKLDADCAGRPLGRWVLDAVEVAGLLPGVIVTGTEVPLFAAAARGWRVLVNPDAEAGLGTSVAAAAREAQRSGADRLLLLLADMPLVCADYLARIAAAPAPAATRHPDGRPGVPALFAAKDFAALAALSGDRGAGAVLSGTDGVTLLEPPADLLSDVDTLQDLARVARVVSQRLALRSPSS